MRQLCGWDPADAPDQLRQEHGTLLGGLQVLGFGLVGSPVGVIVFGLAFSACRHPPPPLPQSPPVFDASPFTQSREMPSFRATGSPGGADSWKETQGGDAVCHSLMCPLCPEAWPRAGRSQPCRKPCFQGPGPSTPSTPRPDKPSKADMGRGGGGRQASLQRPQGVFTLGAPWGPLGGFPSARPPPH